MPIHIYGNIFRPIGNAPLRSYLAALRVGTLVLHQPRVFGPNLKDEWKSHEITQAEQKIKLIEKMRFLVILTSYFDIVVILYSARV